MNRATDISNLRDNQKQSAPSNFPAMLKKYQGEIARALPKHISGDRMARIALTEFRKNPALGKCDPRSVFAAVVQASQLGLEPGIVGQAYLIPYGTECQLVPGWMGLNDLASRSGRASTWTGAVYYGDDFDYALGDRPFLTHKPCGESDPDKLTHIYAIGRVKEGEWPIIEVWPVEKARKHRDRYNRVGKRHYSFRHFEMYARKVALLQVLKYMPKSIELSMAMEMDQASEDGSQGLNVADAIEGTWARVEETEHNDEHDVTQQTAQGETQQHEEAEWPRLINHPERGQIWVDSVDARYDKELHSWSRQTNKPIVNSDGTFRARRGARKAKANQAEQQQSRQETGTEQPAEKPTEKTADGPGFEGVE